MSKSFLNFHSFSEIFPNFAANVKRIKQRNMNRILRFLRLSVCAVLVMLSGAGLLHAQNYSGLPGRKLVCTYTVGDAMGDVKNSITKQEHFFVGADNRPVRGCLLGSGTGSEFTLT